MAQARPQIIGSVVSAYVKISAASAQARSRVEWSARPE